METRDEIKALLGKGGVELEVFFGMWEGMMRTSLFVRDAFKGGMKTLERMASTPEVAHVYGLLNTLILDMEADAFADGEPQGFPTIGAPSGLEALPPLPQLLGPIRRRLPRFVKTETGQFINMRNVESLWPCGLLYLQQEAVQLTPEERETLAALLDEHALPLGRIEATVPTEGGQA